MSAVKPSVETNPVLVGIGVATRREENYRDALEPLDLMLEAVQISGEDTGNPKVLRGVQYVAVPRGRWVYRNPGAEIAQSIGAYGAVSVLSTVGVLQQTLVADACAAIARGEVHTALVTGADAGYRLLRAQIEGATAAERNQDTEPGRMLAPAQELRHPAELRAGLQMPVGLYAVIESAMRAARGLDVEPHRDHLGALGARFSEIAADNPHAWSRRRLNPAEVRDASARNPMQAFPYTRNHCSSWNVDQGAALLFCSIKRARELGIPESQWIHLLSSAESNHMVPLTARAALHECPGASATAEAAFNHSGMKPEDVDIVDLYSCFPAAVQLYAAAAGLDENRDLTVTGGMALAGGPYNNYMLQAVCRAAEQLRAGKGTTALVSCVSGIVTKQAFSLWSREPARQGFARIDVSAETAARTAVREVVVEYSGAGTIAGCTVLHGRDRAPRAVAVVDTAAGARAVCWSEDEQLIERMQREEFVQRPVEVTANVLRARES